ncbi:recombinase family protein [Spirillospora sp. CA-108201]
MTGKVWAYARVSTRDQNPQLQLDALEADGYDELVMEKESGKRGTARPGWEELLTKPVADDTLKFWKSDRWGRSAGHVLTTVTELRERGVRVVSLTENFDLETKEGRFIFPRRGRRVRTGTARRTSGRGDRRRQTARDRREDAARQAAHRPTPSHRPH